MKYSVEHEQQLFNDLWSDELKYDPLRFVMYAYPWGKAGTPLENEEGPRRWQAEYLTEIGNHLQAQRFNLENGLPLTPWRSCTISGRGPGKSALCGWLTGHSMTCFPGSTTILTANTEAQLKSRTFAEVTKWNTLAINAHWFDTSVLSMRPAAWFDKLLRAQLQIDTGYYYAQGQLWSEEKPDAFAGVHNPLGVRVIFDEASGIPGPIWEITEGFFTEPILPRFWDVFSNPRKLTSELWKVCNERSEFWRLRQIDSRTVEGLDQALIARLVEQYGIESDTVRVEVLGQFPQQGEEQFISSKAVQDAQLREFEPDAYASLIMGVDVARAGRDNTVIRWRQGRDARSIPPRYLKGFDNMAVANEIARLIDQTKPDAVCIDAGEGVGVIDRLKEMRYRVHEVWFGSASPRPEFHLLRTHLYASIRDWLPGAMLDGSADLFRDLTAVRWKYYGTGEDVKILESKKEMRTRGLPSPDDGDALACTFAVNVARRDNPRRRQLIQANDTNYRRFH